MLTADAPAPGQGPRCTMTEDALRQFVLDWLGAGWTGRAIRHAPSLEAATRLAQAYYGEAWASGYGPGQPYINCQPAGVAYQRDLLVGDTRRYRLTWRQVAAALRQPAQQLALFAPDGVDGGNGTRG